MSKSSGPDPSRDGLPRVMGPLRLERRLGAGGMGTVYESVLLEPRGALAQGTRLAAKVFREDVLEGPRGLERLRREAGVGMRLAHPAIVRTHELIEIEDAGGARHVLLMELVEGTTLRWLLDDLGALPEPLLRHVGHQLALALAAVHREGIVHRDVKPENVLVGADHEVKLTDLGIARPLADSGALTTRGAFLGSVAYASPEHLGTGTISPSSDLYSLGILLYEAACGRRPFEDPTIAGLLRRHLEQRPRRLGEVVLSISPFLEDLVATLLEKDPARRIGSADELALILAEGEASAWWRARDGNGVEAAALRHRACPSPLIGRESELRTSLDMARRALAGAGGLLLIEGEAGVGKSHLVDEVLDRIAELLPTPLILRGENPPGGAGSRGAVAESLGSRFAPLALRRLLETHLGGSLELLPVLEAWALGAPPPAGAVLTRDMLNASLVRLASGVALEQPIAWVLEDVHFASAEERALLAVLSRAAASRRIFLIATMRPGLPADELAALERLGARRLSIGRLSARAVVDLLAESLGSRRLAEDLGGRVAAKTDGNPYFVLEVVRDLKEKGAVRRGDDGAWSAVGRISAIDVPTSVKSLMLERAAALAGPERAIVDAAAVQGFHFEGDLVAEVLDASRLATLQSLAAIERRTGLVRAVGARYQFDHHQLQEVLVEAVPEPLRIELHALLARRLETRIPIGAEEGELAARVVRHALAGGLLDLAEKYLAPAFLHLRRRLQNESAIEIGLLGMQRFPRGSTARALLGSRLAYTCELVGRREEALAFGEEAVADADASGDAASGSQAHHALAMVLSRASQLARAEEVALRGRELGQRSGNALVETKHVATLGTIAAMQGHVDRATQLFREAAESFDAIGSRADLGIALGNLSQALAWTDGPQALGYARRSLALAQEAGDVLQAMHAALLLGMLLGDEGEFDAGEAQLKAGLDRAQAFSLAHLQVTGLERLAALHLARGRLADCRAALEEGLALARASRHRTAEGRLLAHAATLARQEDRLDAAREALRNGVALEIAGASPRDASMVHVAGIALEWISGDADRARDHAAEARELCGGTEDARLQAWAALLLGSEPPSEEALARLQLVPRIEALAALAATQRDASARAALDEALAALVARAPAERALMESGGVVHRARAIAGA